MLQKQVNLNNGIDSVHNNNEDDDDYISELRRKKINISLYKRHWHGRWHGGRGYCPYPYGPGSWYLNGPKRWYPYVVGNTNIVQIKSCVNNNDCPQGYTCFRNRCYLNEIFDRAINRYNPYFYNRRSY
uniref:WAP domain-containing protein n=1 Tax=Strongyloides papillosus TaxID=174720 RepID=A0A0N5BH19_STREA